MLSGFPEGAGWSEFGDMQVSYDFERQALGLFRRAMTRFISVRMLPYWRVVWCDRAAIALQTLRRRASTALATVSALASADGDKAIVLTNTMVPAGDLIAEQRNQRYGIEVNFLDGSFVISSGTTGDGSSIAIRNVLTTDDANGGAAYCQCHR
jgi:hypothetical protein